MRTYLLKLFQRQTGNTEINGGGTAHGAPLCTIYRVTWYLRLLALSVLTCSPNISFLARLVSGSPGTLEKLELETPSSPATSKEKISARVRVIVRGFDLLSSINFSGFPNLPITLIIGVTPEGPEWYHWNLRIWFPIVSEAVYCTVS